MSVSLGYLLPTRERIMVGVYETDQILKLGDKAEEVGLDSVWIGDSLLAKPRHEPLALIAATAARGIPMVLVPVAARQSGQELHRARGDPREVQSILPLIAASHVPFRTIGVIIGQSKIRRPAGSRVRPLSFGSVFHTPNR